MKIKKVSRKLTLSKTTIQDLNTDTMNYIKAGWYKDSVNICTIPGTDCYCPTRPPACTNTPCVE